jgi:hypothetical protein
MYGPEEVLVHVPHISSTVAGAIQYWDHHLGGCNSGDDSHFSIWEAVCNCRASRTSASRCLPEGSFSASCRAASLVGLIADHGSLPEVLSRVLKGNLAHS